MPQVRMWSPKVVQDERQAGRTAGSGGGRQPGKEGQRGGGSSRQAQSPQRRLESEREAEDGQSPENDATERLNRKPAPGGS